MIFEVVLIMNTIVTLYEESVKESKCTIYFVMQVLKQQFKTKIKLNRAKPTQSPIICTKVIKTLPNEIPR